MNSDNSKSVRGCDIIEHFAWIFQDENSGPPKVLRIVWKLWTEVNADGFAFYFFYDSESVPFIVNALIEIGAHKTAEICLRAMEIASLPVVPKMLASDASPYDSYSEDVLTQLNELDQEFFEPPDDLEDLLLQYITKHGDVFVSVQNAGPKTQ